MLDHDLVRTEFDPLSALVRQGKRSIVLLNKTDRFPDADRDAILAKLRERLRGLVAARRRDRRRGLAPADRRSGSAATTARPRRSSRPSRPSSTPCARRIAPGPQARGRRPARRQPAAPRHLLSRKAQDQLSKERDERAEQVIEKFQWITAATSFTNPFPALELLASGAVQFQMISELAECLRRHALDVERPGDRHRDDPDAGEARAWSRRRPR